MELDGVSSKVGSSWGGRDGSGVRLTSEGGLLVVSGGREGSGGLVEVGRSREGVSVRRSGGRRDGRRRGLLGEVGRSVLRSRGSWGLLRVGGRRRRGGERDVGGSSRGERHLLLLLLVLRRVRLSVGLVTELGGRRRHATVVLLVLLIHRRVLLRRKKKEEGQKKSR